MCLHEYECTGKVLEGQQISQWLSLKRGVKLGERGITVIFTLFTSELEEYRNRKNIL